jgi:hypothetical protein
MPTNLPDLTRKQQTLLHLIYKHRFINTLQIQLLLNHKDKRRILSWLKDLGEKEYIVRIYDKTHLATRVKPAVYYLSLNGIRYLRSLDMYPEEELRKRYKEPARTPGFIEKSLFIADCCTTLKAKNKTSIQYTYATPADYSNPDDPSYFLSAIQPSLYFVKHESGITTEYIFEILEPTLPPYQVRKRLREYIRFLHENDWEDWEVFHPVLLIACTDTFALLRAKRYMRRLLEKTDDQDIPIRLATRDDIKSFGITERVWVSVKHVSIS